MCSPVVAQQIPSAESNSQVSRMPGIGHIQETLTDYYTQPLDWNRGQWFRTGVLSALTLTSMSLDSEVRMDVQEWRDGRNHVIMQFGRWAGLGVPTVGLAAGLYTIGDLRENTEMQATGRLLWEAFITGGLTTTLIKTLTGRHRPYLGDGALAYSPPGLRLPYRAFPSGHSTIGWLTAGVLAKRTESVLLKSVYYTSAGIISVSRIYHDKHWLSDTLLGGFIGYGAAKFVVEREEQRKTSSGGNISVIPMVGWHRVVISVCF
ncbi:MAG TPA: phosphatase PAP2 family protein [bacterium]|nr:phosphatase PAP2 family protein [bacterium]